jgi:hypothetical protein
VDLPPVLHDDDGGDVMESSTTTGAAISMGIIRASSGTAIRPSPKPKVERISVAKNTTSRTCRVVVSAYLPRASPRAQNE